MRHGALAVRRGVVLGVLLAAGTGPIADAQEPARGQQPAAAPADSGAPGDPAPSSEILDEARVFSAEARSMVEDDLAGFDAPIRIETIPSLGGRTLDEVAMERARQSGRTGLYVLISVEERELGVMASRDYMETIDGEARAAIRDAFLGPLRAGAYDRGLVRGVGAIGRVLAGSRASAPGEPRGDVGAEADLISRGHLRLTLGGAELILRAARDQAESMGLKVNIAVVDDGGHLIAFARMDGARPGSGYTAQTKAVAAATFRMPTGPIPPGIDDPEPILNLGLMLTAMAGGGRSTPLYGGVPIEIDGQVIGAVGVGGATGEQDAEIARSGIASLRNALERPD